MPAIPIVGAVAGGIIGAIGSTSAADTQAHAAEYAANLQHQDAQAALAFQQKEFDTQEKNIQPWLTAGKGALSTLTSDLPELTAPYGGTFSAPTAAEAQQTPGYQFTLQQGELALGNSAAARGGALSGGTAKDIAGYAEGLANTTYGDVFNRALTTYSTNFNTFQANQANKYNRLAAVAGTGQTAATTLGQQGQAAANNVSNTLLTAGAQVGQSIQNAGAATASGYVGAANAANSAISGISGYAQLQQILAAQAAQSGGGGSTDLSKALPIDPNTGMPTE